MSLEYWLMCLNDAGPHLQRTILELRVESLKGLRNSEPEEGGRLPRDQRGLQQLDTGEHHEDVQ